MWSPREKETCEGEWMGILDPDPESLRFGIKKPSSDTTQGGRYAHNSVWIMMHKKVSHLLRLHI